ncbi:hypothetical protein ETAA8_48740 [Anatilimnocola aggregata]|uniref:LamG-like jellyroll fold domain-containing protein n=1 Tax=Anatilimnocola aggregata TaxID=2528021 RepID=A0A517YHR9_9BACT|nr:DUF1553 domain-containing protein [Anatilimnocola aggregata]QDU29759.1 hypothetical protein ETAA8_48740 [Anatilimnocola aggregata]
MTELLDTYREKSRAESATRVSNEWQLHGKLKAWPSTYFLFDRRLPTMIDFVRPAVFGCLLGLFAQTALAQNDTDDAPASAAGAYAEIIEADQPIAWWRFQQEKKDAAQSWAQPVAGENATAKFAEVEIVGKVTATDPGPRPPRLPLFTAANTAAKFGTGNYLRLADPGDKSPFDFEKGDSITLEAWVNPSKLGDGQQVYLIGKGRTGNAGFAKDNQNYALRIHGAGGQAKISFLFRSADNRRGEQDDWHRWNSTASFSVGTGWHYLAVTYRFGDAKSIRGFIDGKPTGGAWDYGGPSDEAPVVDNDEIWLGTASGGNAANSYQGLLDEVAIYRTALSAERIAARWKVIQPEGYVTKLPLKSDEVLVEVFEGLPDAWSWDFVYPQPTERWSDVRFALSAAPQKYGEHGTRIDRGSPHVLWYSSKLNLPAGEQRLLLRSRHAARLYLDGKLVVQNPFPSGRTDGHNAWMPVTSKISKNIRALQPGDQENVVELKITPGLHELRLEVFVAGKKRRHELGETSVSIAPAGSDAFQIVSCQNESFPLSDEAWLAFEDAQRLRLRDMNQLRRAQAGREYNEYWNKRHQYAQAVIKELPAIEKGTSTAATIDRFIGERLKKEGVEPTALLDDTAFVRRIYLDIVGVGPAAEQVQSFVNDKGSDRRARLIDQLLAQPGWADNWMGYWQDVLAENPNIINPTLNNTGPFRFWLYESLLDNKPFDRFATDLVLMDGSPRQGGPGGFAIASENDAPMAAKSHVLAKALLGMEMNCARCHDAPFHPFKQEQLFNLAAMLGRATQSLPKTSTIPGGAGALKSDIVKISLKPGDKIAPTWPFAGDLQFDLPADVVRKQGDTREELALRLTLPQNERTAEVLVNRFWQRYLGRGIVEPVDDWEQGTPSHPELLEYLARQFIESGYDMKQLARAIFNSQAYQRQTSSDLKLNKLFAAPVRRRLSAEQVLDSLFAAADKRLHCEELNIDVDGSRLEASSISLGLPERAWQFTSLSNERDRPSLSLPSAQPHLNVLEAFGWRASRQDPLTVREKEPTVLQPAVIANGTAAKRIAQMSEDSRFTRAAVGAKSPADFTREVYLQILGREPTAGEFSLGNELLTAGFDKRLTGAKAGPIPSQPARDGVSWSNHLQSKANEIRVQRAEEVERGDPPTTLLTEDWRMRAEDLVWALMNSPEFVFVP